ncbi:MAG TPA: hypothetical protein VLZ74_09935 [Methylocella sp.]|nr:hypothetical protein [Methylocella sp.]
MADYYPLLAKAVAGLPDSTAEARQAVYERARKALFGQLRALDPPVPEEAIDREAQALERAVAQLETEIASSSMPEHGGPAAEATLAEPPPPAAPLRANGASSAPTPPKPPGPEPRGFVGRSAKPTPGAAKPARPAPPPLKIRREPPGPSPAGEAGERPRPREAPKSGGRMPLSGQGLPAAILSASNSSAMRNERPLPPSGMGPREALARGPDAVVFPEGSRMGPQDLSSPSFETFVREAEEAGSQSYEPEAKMRIEAQRPFAPRLEGGDNGAARRVGIVAGVVALLVALVAVAAYKLRDRPEDLVRLQPSSATVQGEAGAGGKIADRVSAGATTPGGPAAPQGTPSSAAERSGAGAAKSGSVPATPPVPVARRAALLMEAPEEQSKVKTVLGTVVWRVDNVSNGPDEPLRMAVRAEIDIPDEGMQGNMTIQKNYDSTLPASHTIKLSFSARPGGPLVNIKQVSVLLRREDTPSGEALKGITVPVTENSFLIGLSRGDGEASNLDLLRSREWFDIPMVLANGHVAKLTFEKGPSGRSAFEDALASWQGQ